MKYSYGIVDTKAPEVLEFVHEDDVSKISSYGFLALKIGRFEDTDSPSEYVYVDFGFVRIRIKRRYLIKIDPIPYFIGDTVIANGDKAEIMEALWNYRGSYPYFIVRKGKKNSTKWYTKEDLKENKE